MSLFDDILGENYQDIRAVVDFVDDLLVVFEAEMAASGVSQADLAKRLALSPARVSQMFSGNGQNFTAATIAKIAHSLGKVARIELSEAVGKSSKTKKPKGWDQPVPNWETKLVGQYFCANDNPWSEEPNSSSPRDVGSNNLTSRAPLDHSLSAA
jgi:transcriptional regulator with XRE-family HTH domain